MLKSGSMRRNVVFHSLFVIYNLAFIPLLSLYGLRVCPVLTIPGFGFGCYYAALFIGTVLAFNFGGQFIFPKSWSPFVKALSSYLIATLASLAGLAYLLNLNHLSPGSRAPQILLLASLLLGFLQAYGKSWVEFKIPATFDKNLAARVPSEAVSTRRAWVHHTARILFPLVTVGLILAHFLLTQSPTFSADHRAPSIGEAGLITQTGLLISFLAVWLLTVLTFHFLMERDLLLRIERLIQNQKKQIQGGNSESPLSNENSNTSSADSSWGLWRLILVQLNDLTKTLNERTRLLRSFSQFVTEGVARAALNSDSLEQGATKDLTVIMVDIRDFTALSEKLSAEKVVRLLNEYFAQMLNVIAKHHIHVDKFIGDGILAYAEQNEVEPNQAVENRRAVMASIEMTNALRTLNQRYTDLGLPHIKIGIGIYRGPLVIGVIGTSLKLQHTIIGDTVNRTARIEGLCKELQVPIAISGWVYHSLPTELQSQFRSFGQRTVKGIEEPMEVFGFQPTLRSSGGDR